MWKLTEFIKKWLNNLMKSSFPFWQRLGINITRNYYYSPIPDIKDLKGEIWSRKSQLIGIDINEKMQLEFLSKFETQFKEEYNKFPKNKNEIFKPFEYYVNNISFGPVSGEILYCFIRYFKPKRIIEIGSGYSTYCSAKAILKNKEIDKNYECELIAIEPFPNDILKRGFPGFKTLIKDKVQNINLKEFEKLQNNDILFIDSSHVLKIGSDVQYEYLEILPRLNKGVIVHIHDILLPAEYHKEWILKHQLFWNEQYFLQAFLMFNKHFEILWAGSYLHFNHPDKLESAFNTYQREKRFSTSFWMKKIL